MFSKDRVKFFVVTILITLIQSLSYSQAVLVKDINPGALAVANYNYTSLQINDIIYFIGDISAKRDLYSIKGGEVTHISQLCSESCSFFEEFLFAFQNNLYFLKKIDSNINQLWKTDGSLLGTSMVFEYKGSFKSFAIGNNSKIYLGLGSRETYKDEIYITDGTTNGTKKLNDNMRFGGSEEKFGAPVKYGNGVAFANIMNDSLELFGFDDETLTMIASIKVKPGSSIYGLKVINEENLLILIHSDVSASSELLRFNSSTKQIKSEKILPYNYQKFPYFKDFGKDSLILYYYQGGHFLLSGNPLLLENITPYSPSNRNLSPYYYNIPEKLSAYLTHDDSFNAKIAIFRGDPTKTKIYNVEYSDAPSLIGYDDFAFYKSDDPVGKSGKITIFNLNEDTKKEIFTYSQTFSSGSLNPLGVQGSKLYFLGKLNQEYGRELYYVETGIKTSDSDFYEKLEFSVIFNNNNFKISTNQYQQNNLKLSVYNNLGQLIMNQDINTNTEYQLNGNMKGLMFFKISHPSSNYSNTSIVFIP